MGDAEGTSQYHRRLARPRGFSISDESSFVGRLTLFDNRHALGGSARKSFLGGSGRTS